MGLQNEIKELKGWVVKNVPRETRDIITRAINRLEQSGIVNKACRAGDEVPSFTLPNVKGEIISSTDLLKKRATGTEFLPRRLVTVLL